MSTNCPRTLNRPGGTDGDSVITAWQHFREHYAGRMIAMAQFHKVLSIEPDNRRADQHLRALMGEPKTASVTKAEVSERS
jgi:hypothetical protein